MDHETLTVIAGTLGVVGGGAMTLIGTWLKARVAEGKTLLGALQAAIEESKQLRKENHDCNEKIDELRRTLTERDATCDSKIEALQTELAEVRSWRFGTAE